MTSMSTTSTSTTSTSTTRSGTATAPVLATVATTGVAALGIGAVVTWVEARASGDTAYLSGDLLALSVVAALGMLLVGSLAAWGVRGSEQRARRLVIGLAAAAALLFPVMWWNAVPLMMAAAVLAVTAQVGRERMPRAAVLAAVMVVVGVLAMWTGSVLAELL